jgi:DNA-binding MarR family transcriptional regulator
MTKARALTPEHEAAWRGYLRSHALLVRRLDADLRAAHGISLLTYDALVQLSEAPGKRLHMKDLAAALVYSASGLTRIVDGLEREGFAQRLVDPGNRRATLVSITDEGTDALAAAWPTHVDGVRRHFADHVPPTKAVAMGAAFRAIVDDLED